MPKEWDGSWTPKFFATRNVVDDFGNLIRVRRCTQCRRWLPEAENFTPKYRNERGVITLYDARCYKDRARDNTERAKRRPKAKRSETYRKRYQREKADDRLREAKRKRTRESQRRYRARHPEREKASKARYAAKIRADRKRYAQRLADNRMWDRLRKERNGHVLQDPEPKTNGGPELPLAPLQDRIFAMLRARRIKIDVSNDTAYIDFLSEFGIEPRSMLDWRKGKRKTIRFDYADKILAHTGLNWWDIWTEEDEGYEKVREAFEGE